MTYDEAVAEKQRRGAANAPGPTILKYEQAVAEKQRRAAAAAVEAQRRGETGIGTTIDDYGRLAATGASFGLSDRLAAGANTLAGNVLSSVKINGQPLGEDVDYADALRQQKEYNAISEARTNDRLPYSGTATKGVASLIGPGKAVKALKGAKALLAPVVGGAAGGANAYLNDGDWRLGIMMGAGGGAAYPLTKGLGVAANLLTPPIVKMVTPGVVPWAVNAASPWLSMAPAAAQGE